MPAELIESKNSFELREAITADLRVLREWINGPGVPLSAITPKRFPFLAKYAPESLEMLGRLARANVESDFNKLEVREKHPEIWDWPDERERVHLIACVLMGFGDKELEVLKAEYRERFREGKNRRTGFGTSNT